MNLKGFFLAAAPQQLMLINQFCQSMIITHYFDWQDTFTEYCVSKQFDSELFDFNVDKRIGSYF